MCSLIGVQVSPSVNEKTIFSSMSLSDANTSVFFFAVHTSAGGDEQEMMTMAVADASSSEKGFKFSCL